MKSSKELSIVVVAIIIVIGIAVITVLTLRSDKTEEGQACTLEALLCPDGSAVGRIPLSCEFAPCP